MKEFNINEHIWFFKKTNNPVDGLTSISDLKCDTIIKKDTSETYHNMFENVYTLNNGKTISDIEWYIYGDEDEAIDTYNKTIEEIIKMYDGKILYFMNHIKSLQFKKIRQSAL